jgi:hypothetical protein
MAIDYERFCVGKRGKAKIKTDYGIYDFYKYYSKTVTFQSFTSKYSNPSTGLIVDEALYRKIIKDYFLLIAKKLLTSPYGASIFPVGTLRVVKYKMNFKKLSDTPGGLKIDFKLSKEKKQIVYHTNDHRSNCSYRVEWSRNRGHVLLRCFYFRTTRQNKRTLAQLLLKDLTIDFFEKT